MYEETLGRDFSKLRIIGWPRSGTHHVADLFRMYFRLNVPGDNLTRYYTPDHLEPDIWGVYIYRDPRDILVSRFIQMYFRFEDTYQEILNGRTLSQTFREWFIEGEDPHVVPTGTTWREFIYAWEDYLPTQKDIIPVRHETLMEDRKGEFGRILYELGADTIVESQLQTMYDAVMLTKRYPYTYRLHYWEGEKESLPAGIPGEWRNLMDIDTGRAIADYCGDWMVEKGFITDRDWWMECPN